MVVLHGVNVNRENTSKDVCVCALLSMSATPHYQPVVLLVNLTAIHVAITAAVLSVYNSSQVFPHTKDDDVNLPTCQKPCFPK